MDSKLLVIDNFLPQLDLILPKIQEVPLYELKEYTTKFNRKEKWPGKKSQTLIFENSILYAYVMEVVLKKVDFLKNKRFTCEIFLHLRRSEDINNDWIHKDRETFSCLIYLNKTNLSSGTKIYTEEKEETGDIKYVQNRFVMYNGTHNHMGYGHFGKTPSDGRLTFNLFINIL